MKSLWFTEFCVKAACTAVDDCCTVTWREDGAECRLNSDCYPDYDAVETPDPDVLFCRHRNPSWGYKAFIHKNGVTGAGGRWRLKVMSSTINRSAQVRYG